MEYIPLKQKTLDPNRAKIYAVGVSAVAALIAFVTIKSNWAYFAQYYEGWDFWLRVVPFCAVEATIISLPLVFAWGNPRQVLTMEVAELTLICLAILHTYYVSDATTAKIQMSRAKEEASAGWTQAQTIASQNAAENRRMQEAYNQTLDRYNTDYKRAMRLRLPLPARPTEPKYLDVPNIDQKTVSVATTSVEAEVETKVPHGFLLKLLWGMIACVVITWALIAQLAEASRLSIYLRKKRSAELTADLEKELPKENTSPSPALTPEDINRLQLWADELRRQRRSPAMSPSPAHLALNASNETKGDESGN